MARLAGLSWASRRSCAAQAGVEATEPTQASSSTGGASDLPRPPSRTQLRMLGLASALPFIGFGFLDNFLMIICGEFIDSTLCVYFSLSTMAAAAIGNTISDCAGIFSGGAVESLAAKFGVEEPYLAREQRQMRVTKVWQYAGQVIGIVIGCTLGCCPLLWLDPEAAQRLKKDRERDHIFDNLVEKVAEMLNAEAAELLFMDAERGDLHARHVTKNLKQHRWNINDGFIGHAVTTGKFVNVAEVQEEPQYTPELHDDFLGPGQRLRNMLCLPVFVGGKIEGAIVVINKRDDDDCGIFTSKDEDVLAAISTHVAVAISDEKENFAQVLESCGRARYGQGDAEWDTANVVRRNTYIKPMLAGMASFLDAESISVVILDEEHDELYTEAASGRMAQRKRRIQVGAGFAGLSVEKGLALAWTINEPGQFQPKHYENYLGSGVDVKSALCVPIFDTRRKCLGAFECINKRTGAGFDADDLKYMQQVAGLFAQMLEGPTAELRRVLALTKQKQQHKVVTQGSSGDGKTILCYLEQAQDLPKGIEGERLLDPYFTFHIVHGDPLLIGEEEDLGNTILKQRQMAMKRASWHIGKSEVRFQQQNPQWDESLAFPVPENLHRVPKNELYLHILLWDYDPLKEDNVVAQASVPVIQMPRMATKNARPYRLHAVDSNYSLKKARIWLSCSRV